jgi:hypothetical protein
MQYPLHGVKKVEGFNGIQHQNENNLVQEFEWINYSDHQNAVMSFIRKEINLKMM